MRDIFDEGRWLFAQVMSEDERREILASVVFPNHWDYFNSSKKNVFSSEKMTILMSPQDNCEDDVKHDQHPKNA